MLNSLDLAVQKGHKSITLPPLGVGRRFDFGRYTTGLATMRAIQEFLNAKRGYLKVSSSYSVNDTFKNDLKIV